MISREIETYIRNYCGDVNGDEIINTLIKACLDGNLDISIRELINYLQTRYRRNSEFVNTPTPILELIKEVIKLIGCNEIYLPFSSGGDIEYLNNEEFNVDFQIDNQYLLEFVFSKLGKIPISIEEVNKKFYKLIYAEMLLCARNHRETVVEKLDKVLPLIADDGFLIVSVLYNSIRHPRISNWISKIEKEGFYISAIIDVQEGHYKPIINSPSKLLIISKYKHENMFLAKLKNENDGIIIAKNLCERTNDNVNDHHGFIINPGEWSDFTSYENEQRRLRISRKMSKDYHGELVKVESLIKNVIDFSRPNIPNVTMDNPIIIPSSTMKDVFEKMDESTDESRFVIQIDVNENKIIPRFLIYLLNSERGKELRERANGGRIHMPLTVNGLKEMEIPLPPIEEQIAILDTYDELTEIENQVSQLKTKLESIPASYKKINNEIKDINNKGDKFEQWIETLPYPLATVLRRYSSEDNFGEKQKMLFFYFEAYSIFISSILSAALNQASFISSEIKNVDAMYFEKSSFGSWVRMGQELAYIFRKEFEDPQNLDLILNAFHTDDRSVVNAICNPKKYSLLLNIVSYRNNWKGHTGIDNNMILEEHVKTLSVDLDTFKRECKDLYEKVRLIRPVSLRKKDGKFINTVEVLTGSNPIFKKDELIGEALDETKLYLQMLDTNETLELPPYFVMKNSPADAKNACYFYSRIENGNSKYVSYHFEGRPESYEDGEQTLEYIKAILER